MKHKVMLMGEPGVGKSLAGLSYPGVQQHVWGSSEEDTAINFPQRTDILKPLKFNWQDCYSAKDLEAIKAIEAVDEDILIKQKKKELYKNKAKARNVAQYIKYLEGLGREIEEGKHPGLETVFLDNFTPFSEDLWAYTQVLHEGDYTEKNQWNLHTDYQNYIKHVLDLLDKLPIHAIISIHVVMELDEEMKSKTNFLEQAKVASRKEWQPNLMGKFKYQLAGKFSFAFYMFTEEEAGKDTKYLAKVVADSQNVGVAKSRINPFEADTRHANGRRIVIPKGGFYGLLEDALNKYKQGGK